MRYIVIKDLLDETNEVYGIIEDDGSVLIQVLDKNCLPCALPTEHIFDREIESLPCM